MCSLCMHFAFLGHLYTFNCPGMVIFTLIFYTFVLFSKFIKYYCSRQLLSALRLPSVYVNWWPILQTIWTQIRHLPNLLQADSMLRSYQVGGNRKCNQQSTSLDQKSMQTVFSIAICRQWGDKWQSKTLFLLIFSLHSSIVLAFWIAAYPV